jgi:hypothetical protein
MFTALHAKILDGTFFFVFILPGDEQLFVVPADCTCLAQNGMDKQKIPAHDEPVDPSGREKCIWV